MNLFQNDAGAVSYSAGQHIFRRGDASGGEMFAVAEGEVEIQIDGRTMDVVRAGGIFGEMGLIDNATRSADATTKTPAKIVTINERRFNFLVQNNPFFALQVMRVMTDRIRKLSQVGC